MAEQKSYYKFANVDGILSINGNSINAMLPYTYYIDLYYPVGTYYCSMSENFDPNEVFVGTWVRDTDGLVTVAAEIAGTTGGEETHTITTAELPSHKHSTHRVMYGDYNQDDMTGTWNHFYSTGNLDYVYNGVGTIKFTDGGQAHNNIQKSIIGIRWHRIA